MNNFYRYLLAGAALLAATQAQAQSVGIGNTNPDANAALDISSGAGTNKGLLVPRLTYAQRTAITTTTQALLVYQTDDAQPGFWYFQGGVWVPLGIGAGTGAQGWLVAGNAGTAPVANSGVGANTTVTGTSFLGTTDNKDLVIGTAGAERFRITTDGSLYSRSTFGLILNQRDAPLITRGWNPFATGTYAGLGRWGLFMLSSRLALGIPANTGSFSWVTWKDDSSLNNTLMTLNNNGNLGLGINATSPFSRFSLGPDLNTNAAAGRLALSETNGGLSFYGLGLVKNPANSAGLGLWGGTSSTSAPYNGAGGTLPNLYLDQATSNVGVGTISPTSAFTMAGALAAPYTDTGNASTFTLDNTHQTVRRFAACSAITVPQASTCLGRVYTLISSNNSGPAVALNVTTAGFIYDDVANSNITSLAPNNRLTIQSDGTNWIVVGR